MSAVRGRCTRGARSPDILGEHEHLHRAAEAAGSNEALERQALAVIERVEVRACQRHEEVSLVHQAERRAALSFGRGPHAREVDVRGDVLLARDARATARRCRRRRIDGRR